MVQLVKKIWALSIHQPVLNLRKNERGGGRLGLTTYIQSGKFARYRILGTMLLRRFASIFFFNSNFVRDKFVKSRSFINLSWGHTRSQKNVEPDQFSRFDVYWIKKQTDTQTSKVYIYPEKGPKREERFISRLRCPDILN